MIALAAMSRRLSELSLSESEASASNKVSSLRLLLEFLIFLLSLALSIAVYHTIFSALNHHHSADKLKCESNSVINVTSLPNSSARSCVFHQKDECLDSMWRYTGTIQLLRNPNWASIVKFQSHFRHRTIPLQLRDQPDLDRDKRRNSAQEPMHDACRIGREFLPDEMRRLGWSKVDFWR